MSKINCCRIQYSVGQGGFHSGIITYPHLYQKNLNYNKFVYFFDCGSSINTIRLNDSVDRCIDILKKYSNLTYCYIFISHLHNDHINGLDYLCNKIEQLNIVHNTVIVLPFTDEAEKVITIAENPDMSEENIEFILNPESFIRNRYGGFEIQYLNDNDSNSFDRDYDLLYNIPNADEFGNLSHFDAFSFNNNKFLYKWILKPFYNKMNDCVLQKIKAKLTGAGITVKNFRDRKFSYKLKQIYKDFNIDLNKSSLCLYSGTDRPVEYLHTGWLHTGDINLNDGDTFKKFSEHYKTEAMNVRVIQIPHHGSSCNSSLSSFDGFKNLKSLFVTTNSNPKGKQHPALHEEYLEETIIKLTENAKDIWSYESTTGRLLTNFG